MTIEEKEQLFILFKSKGKDALKANHYDLVGLLGVGSPDLWKEFLQDSDVNDYIKKETELLQAAEFRKILFDVSDKDTSVGKAQLINAMVAITDKQTKKEGPIVIYSYIQPNEQQSAAENIKRITEDPFIK
jgi:hypothetical protein